MVEKVRRQFIIINNVHVDLNITEPEFISYLSSNQLFDPVRLKTNGVPNEQIKCEIRNNESLKQLLELGIKIGCSNFRIKEWNPQKRPLQCFKCQKLGHHTKLCTSTVDVCLICAGHHKYTSCPRKLIKCANCNNDHVASSRNCPHVVSYLSKNSKENNSNKGNNNKLT